MSCPRDGHLTTPTHCVGSRSPPVLFASVRLHGFLDLLLDGFQVEACALLHWWKLYRGLGELANLLLYELEPPELESEPVIERQRPLIAVGQVRAFEGIEADIGKDRPINLDRAAQPAARLIGEAILEVVDAHRAQRALG